jgi:hypothetical protein
VPLSSQESVISSQTSDFNDSVKVMFLQIISTLCLAVSVVQVCRIIKCSFLHATFTENCHNFLLNKLQSLSGAY